MAASAPTIGKEKSVNYGSLKSRYANIAIREQLAAVWKDVPALAAININRNSILPVPEKLDLPSADKPTQEKTFKVAIVGAGCAGLFTAMIFDHLKERFKLNVDYEILESSSSQRFGGRLYTHYFDVKDRGDHDYYDVGAMRFPDISIMNRTFKLFEKLGMNQFTEEKAKEGVPLGQLRPYYLDGPNTPLRYNDVQIVPKYKGDVVIQPKPHRREKEDVTAKTFRITGLPEDVETATSQELWRDQLRFFEYLYPQGDFPKDPKEVEKFLAQARKFWNHLMRVGDKYSVRQWLTLSEDYTYNTIEWLETFNFGNRWYDQALSEMILEDMDFKADANWWCVEGGSSQITNKMREKIHKPAGDVKFDQRVTKMRFLEYKDSLEGTKIVYDNEIEVTVEDGGKPKMYDAVFNSAPLGSMQRMNLEGLYLNWGTKQAIRSLQYGASCKVGIRFKHLWWMKEPFNITEGGVAKTDLPLRCCVYPSYNIHDYEKDKDGKVIKDLPGVLLVSYTWSQEAQRLGSLIKRHSPEGEADLKTVLIDNLARLHSKNDSDYEAVHRIIHDAYETHFAYDWFSDPHTTGAFAYFGPGQFRNMYPWIVRNTGKHIIIGEAASAHHAWVVGALESAVRGVYQFLVRHAKESDAAKKAQEAYEKDDIAEPFGPLPAEFDRKEDVVYPSPPLDKTPVEKKDHVTLAPTGEWVREQMLIETIRLGQRTEDNHVRDSVDSSQITTKQLEPILEAAKPVRA